MVKLAVRLIAPKLARALSGASSSRFAGGSYRAYQLKPKGLYGLPLNRFIYPCEIIAFSSAASPSAILPVRCTVRIKKVLVSAARTESVAVPTPFRAVNSSRN